MELECGNIVVFVVIDLIWRGWLNYRWLRYLVAELPRLWITVGSITTTQIPELTTYQRWTITGFHEYLTASATGPSNSNTLVAPITGPLVHSLTDYILVWWKKSVTGGGVHVCRGSVCERYNKKGKDSNPVRTKHRQERTEKLRELAQNYNTMATEDFIDTSLAFYNEFSNWSSLWAPLTSYFYILADTWLWC